MLEDPWILQLTAVLVQRENNLSLQWYLLLDVLPIVSHEDRWPHWDPHLHRAVFHRPRRDCKWT